MFPGTVCVPPLGAARTTAHQKLMGPAVLFTPSVPALLPLTFPVWLSLPGRLFLLGCCWESAEGEAGSISG